MAGSKPGTTQKNGALLVLDQVTSGDHLEVGAAEDGLGGEELDAASLGLGVIGDYTDIGTAEDEAADYLLIWDNSASAWKKVLTREFPQNPNYDTLNYATLAPTDDFCVWDVTAGYMKTIDVIHLYLYGGPGRAYRSSDYGAGGSGARKMNLNAENYDTQGWFDASTNYRFQPLMAGYYQINATVTIRCFDTNVFYAMLYKNGAVFAHGSEARSLNTADTDIKTVVSDIVYFNGSTDYVELYCQMGSNRNIRGGSEKTFMSYCRVG